MATPSRTQPPQPDQRARSARLRAWGRSVGHGSQGVAGPFDTHLSLLDDAGIHPRNPPRQVIQREQRYRFALLGADLLAGLAALEVSLSVVGIVDPLRAAILALPLIVLLAKLHGLYDRDDLLVRKTTIEEVPRLFQHAVFATLVLVIVDEPLGIGQTTDTQAATLLGLLFAFSCLARMFARHVACRVSTPERCLVLGDEAAATELHQRTEGRAGIDILGAASLENLTTFADLCRVIDQFQAERLIIVQSSGTPQHQTLELVRAAKIAGVRVSLLPGVLGVVGSQVEFDDVFGVTLLGVRRFGLTRSSSALKRTFDIVCTVPLLILASPVIAAAALAIRADGGPVFFRQERVGLRGRRFQIIKLRTMVDGAEHMREGLAAYNEAGDGLFKMASDPRITKIGALLRRSHLDELPQLWNVLRGEMSMVGPRPLVTDEDARITGLDRRRLELMPGMTGPWQIMGSHRRIPMPEMIKLDYLYVASWSLWNDLKILLRTLGAVAGRAGV
ncbi:MAG: sugar transferase [Solirubrobacterales bacterium]|nr:sugar transferase [Solirubrobacterales bacterium]